MCESGGMPIKSVPTGQADGGSMASMIQWTWRQRISGNADTPLWGGGMSADQGEIGLNFVHNGQVLRISTRSR